MDETGFTFKEAIFPGCKNIDDDIGVLAGSADSYSAFADLFNPIIFQSQGIDHFAPYTKNMDYSQLNLSQTTAEQRLLIKSVRLTVQRNIAGFYLGPGISKDKR